MERTRIRKSQSPTSFAYWTAANANILFSAYFSIHHSAAAIGMNVEPHNEKIIEMTFRGKFQCLLPLMCEIVQLIDEFNFLFNVARPKKITAMTFEHFNDSSFIFFSNVRASQLAAIM